MLDDLPPKIDRIAGDLEEIKTDMKAIKAIAKTHEAHITKIETV